jgi:AraC-like DNA-binding protein
MCKGLERPAMESTKMETEQVVHLLSWNRIQRRLRNAPIVCDRAVYHTHYSRHQHPGTEFLFIRTGAGQLFYGDSFIPFSGPLLVCLDGRTPHGMHITHECERWYLLYGPELLAPHFAQLVPQVPQEGTIELFSITEPMTQLLEELFVRIHRETVSEEHDAQLLVALHVTELLVLTKRMDRVSTVEFGEAENKSRQLISTQMHRLLNYIETHIAEPLSAASIGQALHFSDRYVYKLIRMSTNHSLSQYIRIRRMALAKRLLVSTDKAVYEVGNAVGISNTAHFCRQFRELVGATPSEYRNAYDGGNQLNEKYGEMNGL